MTHDNLLGGPPETLLPPDPAADLFDRGDTPADVARVHPESSLVWAVLAGCFVVGFFGQVLSLPGWLQDLSPFQHVPRLPAASFSLAPDTVVADASDDESGEARRDSRGSRRRTPA